MMLFPDQVKPLLLHEDEHVRRVAAKYMSDSFQQDTELAPMIVEACDRFGEAQSRLYPLRDLVITAEALDAILARLSRTRDRNTVDHLNSAIVGSPVTVLQEHLEAIRGGHGVEHATIERVQRRVQLMELSSDELWGTLRAYAEESEDKQHVGDIDHGYADDLISELARQGAPDAQTLCETIRDTSEGWMEIFAILLAKERRLPETVPYLFEKVYIDTDYMVQCTWEALAAIGDPKTIDLVRQAYPESDWHFRNYASGHLSGLKIQECEYLHLELIEIEEDVSFRTWWCRGLVDLF